MFGILCLRSSHVGCTSSHLNTEVEKLWARAALGWETAWELLVLLARAWILMLLRGLWTLLNPASYWWLESANVLLRLSISKHYSHHQWAQILLNVLHFVELFFICSTKSMLLTSALDFLQKEKTGKILPHLFAFEP